jgi:hypothetical protein
VGRADVGRDAPVIACAVSLSWRRRVPHVLRFFTGFCLIANGAYIGVGWISQTGDAGDLATLGTPVWVMIVFGIACVGSGLWVWHRTRGVAGIEWR